jgi:hypothetical protein
VSLVILMFQNTISDSSIVNTDLIIPTERVQVQSLPLVTEVEIVDIKLTKPESVSFVILIFQNIISDSSIMVEPSPHHS